VRKIGTAQKSYCASIIKTDVRSAWRTKTALHVLKKDVHFQVKAFVFMVTTAVAQLYASNYRIFEGLFLLKGSKQGGTDLITSETYKLIQSICVSFSMSVHPFLLW